MEASDFIQLGMMLVTVIALIFTVWQFRKQLKLTFFADYTKRYQEIMLNLPESIYQDNFSYNNLDEKERKDFKRYMRIYFNLCSEEYHLHHVGDLDKKVWKEWKEGIKYSFSKPAFQEGWKKFGKDKEYYKDFYNFMINEIQKGD